MQYMHNTNVCHRDLKPDNLIVNTIDFKIKLIDFNVSTKFETTFEGGSYPETIQGGTGLK